RARVRMADLGLARRSSGHTQADRGAPERGARKSDRLARRAREADRAGPRADRLAAGNGDEVDARWPEAHAHRRRSRRNQGRVIVTFTRIDHVMIAVPELDRGVDTYARLGFSVQ